MSRPRLLDLFCGAGDEPWELAEPTRLLADAMRAKTAAYLEAA